MMNNIIGDMNFNRFVNADSIEERIINHFITSDSEYANRICKLLKYSDFSPSTSSTFLSQETSAIPFL